MSQPRSRRQIRPSKRYEAYREGENLSCCMHRLERCAFERTRSSGERKEQDFPCWTCYRGNVISCPSLLKLFNAEHLSQSASKKYVLRFMDKRDIRDLKGEDIYLLWPDDGLWYPANVIKVKIPTESPSRSAMPYLYKNSGVFAY